MYGSKDMCMYMCMYWYVFIKGRMCGVINVCPTVIITTNSTTRTVLLFFLIMLLHEFLCNG
jgi:hypothetical protein